MIWSVSAVFEAPDQATAQSIVRELDLVLIAAKRFEVGLFVEQGSLAIRMPLVQFDEESA